VTGTLALLGGGELHVDNTFEADLVRGATEVLVLPTAQAYEDPASTIAAAAERFGAIDVSVEVLGVYQRAAAFDVDVVARVRSASAVYVTGGSPMHLRSVLKDTPLLDAMVGAWTDGATVAVAAESTSVLCSHMVDSRGGAYTVGLGLVTSMTVIPRHDRWSPDKLHRTVSLAPTDLVVVGIDEATALVREPAGSWSVHGTGGVHVYEGGRSVGVDQLPGSLNPDAGV